MNSTNQIFQQNSLSEAETSMDNFYSQKHQETTAHHSDLAIDTQPIQHIDPKANHFMFPGHHTTQMSMPSPPPTPMAIKVASEPHAMMHQGVVSGPMSSMMTQMSSSNSSMNGVPMNDSMNHSMNVSNPTMNVSNPSMNVSNPSMNTHMNTHMNAPFASTHVNMNTPSMHTNFVPNSTTTSHASFPQVSMPAMSTSMTPAMGYASYPYSMAPYQQRMPQRYMMDPNDSRMQMMGLHYYMSPMMSPHPMQQMMMEHPDGHFMSMNAMYHDKNSPKSRIYKCPKPYCSKIYKNSNGLKYHMEKGSCELDYNSEDEQQQTSGQVKIAHRPYFCKVDGCGKKYKNLNGLKYHAKASHPNMDFKSQVKLHRGIQQRRLE